VDVRLLKDLDCSMRHCPEGMYLTWGMEREEGDNKFLLKVDNIRKGG